MTGPAEALTALAAGGLVVIPTDTVYGLAARPELPKAVGAIFRAKGRPSGKALPVLAASIEDLDPIVRLSPEARRLAGRFWPGPLTLVLPRRPGWRGELGEGASDTVAVRIPRSTVALELLAGSGPLAVTSANRSGEPPARTVEEARAALGAEVEVFVDGGPCAGRASTVLSLVGTPQVMRVGSLSPDQVLGALAP